jgi:dihydropteroate synthase
MGIINVTPDSFSDGGLFESSAKAIAHAKYLVSEGADIVDIGGESTRPGSESVNVAVELSRVIPVIEALVNVNIPVSVDTSKPEVMRQAIKVGATMINDVNALRSPGAIDAVKNSDVLICLMHMQGEPDNMQENPHYKDIVKEVINFLAQRIDTLQTAGISKKRLIVDPGFGFGKKLNHNLKLLHHLGKLNCFQVPILAGLSRKSMLGSITGNKVDQRIHESVAAALLAAVNGAKILRVHDVKATRDAITIYNAMIDVSHI